MKNKYWLGLTLFILATGAIAGMGGGVGSAKILNTLLSGYSSSSGTISSSDTILTAIQKLNGNTPGGGISSLNGLSGATQTFATGNSGNGLNISSVGTAHTFNMPTASATVAGQLASADYSKLQSDQFRSPLFGLTLFEDFINYTSANRPLDLCSSGVSATDNNATLVIPDGTSIGTPYYTMSATNSFMILTPSCNSTNFMTGGGGATTMLFRFYIVDLSDGTDTYLLQMGGGNSLSASNISKGIVVSYSSATQGGNWVLTSYANAASTSINSAIPATTGWHKVEIDINSAGTSISGIVDGVTIASGGTTAITTNIANAYPQVYTSPWLQWTKTAGSGAKHLALDYLYMHKDVTR